MAQRLAFTLAAVALMSGCGPVLVADDARKREVVTRHHVEVWSRGQLDAIDALFAEDVVAHFPGTVVEGRRALRAFVHDQRERHPEREERVQTVIIEGSRGASQVLVIGGPLPADAAPADGDRPLAFEQASLFEFSRGRISQIWVYPDLTRASRLLP